MIKKHKKEKFLLKRKQRIVKKIILEDTNELFSCIIINFFDEKSMKKSKAYLFKVRVIGYKYKSNRIIKTVMLLNYPYPVGDDEEIDFFDEKSMKGINSKIKRN